MPRAKVLKDTLEEQARDLLKKQVKLGNKLSERLMPGGQLDPAITARYAIGGMLKNARIQLEVIRLLSAMGIADKHLSPLALELLETELRPAALALRGRGNGSE